MTTDDMCRDVRRKKYYMNPYVTVLTAVAEAQVGYEDLGPHKEVDQMLVT